MSDFDWSKDNDEILFRSYGSVAVHHNGNADLVIRQERSATDDDYAVIVIAKEHAELLLLAIRDLMGIKL